jgi:cytochrome c oxidase subunit 2
MDTPLMWEKWIPFWQPGNSLHAADVDLLFVGLLIVALLVLALLFFLLITFAVRYRAGHAVDRDDRIKKSWRWETAWTAATFAGFLALVVWGAQLYLDIYDVRSNALPIYVVAKQWMWKVQHPGGQREIDTLHVPMGVPIRLTMTSQDVIHSFFVPAFRVKQDVLPDRYTQLWFTATQAGDYPLYCTQYCGLDHSKMGGQVIVMAPRAYARWLDRNNSGTSLATQGAALFRAKGCSGCHGANASVHAPDLDGIYGRIVHLADGTTVKADDRYIHDSIMLPDKQIVAGYAPIMPSFSGELSEGDVLALIAYLKSTKPGLQPAQEGTKQ